jgi:hypothetical protein
MVGLYGVLGLQKSDTSAPLFWLFTIKIYKTKNPFGKSLPNQFNA